MISVGTNYELLSQDDESHLSSRDSPSAVSILYINFNSSDPLTQLAGKSLGIQGYFIHISIFILGFCAVSDVILTVYAAHFYFKTMDSSYPTKAPHIPLRSTYVGFDSLYANRSGLVQRRPIHNLPRASAQISSSEPTKVFPQWTKTIVNSNGLIPVHTARLQANGQVGFRAWNVRYID
jgi:hypothetical protein